MKNKILILFTISILVLACEKEDNNETLKGQVFFSEEPTYANDTVSLQVEILFAGKRQATNIEIRILEGNNVISNRYVACRN